MSIVMALRPSWALLKTIHVDSRADLDVTGYQHEDGSYTTISKYADDDWNFSAYVRRANSHKNIARINFALTMVDGKSLTDPIHKRLLDGTKAFLYARWMHQGPSSRKFVAATTMHGEWTDLKTLLNWMVENDIRTFSKLTPEICLRYAKEVKSTIAAKGYSIPTAVKKLDVLYKLYEYREYLNDHPPQHPWPDHSAVILIGKSRRLGHYQASTKIIPRRIYSELGRQALDFVDIEGIRILAVFEEFLTIRKQALSNAYERRDYLLDRRRNLRKLRTDAEIESALTDQMRTTFPPFAQKHGFRDLNHFWSELEALRACCYVVCALFSGMRDSELCSLKVGAFSRSLSFDNEEYCWLTGTTYKLEADPKPARWMVPDIVEKAVKVASQLAAPVNEQIEVEIQRLYTEPKPTDPDADRARASRIIELNKLRGNLFVNWTGRLMKASTVSNALSNNNLKQLARRFSLTILQEDLSEIRDRQAILPGDYWPLATHQFRRTFAVFVARNMLGDVRYLRHHFKHWSIDMTLYYASDPLFDDSLLESALSARDQLQASVLSDWLVGDKPLAGGRGSHVMQFRGRDNVKTAKNPDALAKTVGDGVFIRGTGHSWCLATSAGCGGEGLYDAIRCVKCSESVIDQSHVGIWKEIRLQQIETLAWPDMGIPTIERAKNHIREAEAVLCDLGEPMDAYSFKESENVD